MCLFQLPVVLKKTVNIILNRVYNEKLFTKSLLKYLLEKRISATCQKTAFSVNNKLFEQLDGGSMRGSLGPVLSKIIMTQCKIFFVEKLISDNIINFYARYVDDTLLALVKKDINYVLNQCNRFDENLKFTINTFDNCVLHFLNIERVQMCPNMCPNDLVFIIKISKLVNMHILILPLYGSGKLLAFVH